MKQEIKIIDKVIKLSNIGITDVKIIAKIANTTESTVSNYISLGRRQGRIIEKEKVTKYEKVITLYNLGLKNPETISELIVSSINTVVTYINRGKKEGVIDEKLDQCEEHKKTRIEEIADMHNSGKTEEEISEIAGLKIRTVKNYIYSGICLGLIDKKEDDQHKKEEKESNEKESIKTSESEKGKANKPIRITAKRREEVKKLLETMYPIEIAKKLGIRPYDVYNIMDSTPINEMSRIDKKAIENRDNINEQIERLQSEELMGISEALAQIEKTERSTKNLFELADVYYILGAKNACLRVIDKIGKYTKKEVVRQKAIKRRETYEREFLARKISKSYRNSIRIGKNPISYENLCKEFNTNSKFLTEILGEEEKDINR